MAGVLGLGSDGSSGLTMEMIDKLKAAEKKSTVTPLEDKLENFTKESEVVTKVQDYVTKLLAAIKKFSLNQTKSGNAFQQKSATVGGSGVVFDSDDLSKLNNGRTSVKVQQLAQKDVWQTKQFDGTTIKKDTVVNQGTLSINGTKIDTKSKTYEQVVKEINKISGVESSLVEDSNGNFRIAIKSTDSGEKNKISFDGSDTTALSAFGLDDSTNNVLAAQDMKMKVDGIDYTNSTNTMTINGLKITATQKDAESTIDIESDTSNIKQQLQDIVDAYNALSSYIDSELSNDTSSLNDKKTFRDIKEKIKSELFGTGNTATDTSTGKSLFNYGISFDSKSGNMVFSSSEFDTAIKSDLKGLENLFVGVPEKKGIATAIDELISNDGISKTLLDYEANMFSRKTNLTAERDKAQKALDSKYDYMVQRFADYTTIITKMENSFQGLKMIINMASKSS